MGEKGSLRRSIWVTAATNERFGAAKGTHHTFRRSIPRPGRESRKWGECAESVWQAASRERRTRAISVGARRRLTTTAEVEEASQGSGARCHWAGRIAGKSKPGPFSAAKSGKFRHLVLESFSPWLASVAQPGAGRTSLTKYPDGPPDLPACCGKAAPAPGYGSTCRSEEYVRSTHM